MAFEPIEARAADAGRHDRPVRLRLQRAVGGGAGIAVVGEHHAVADEHLVLDRDALADEAVRRDLAARADRRALLDLDEGADLGLVADAAAVEIDQVGWKIWTSRPSRTLSAIGI